MPGLLASSCSDMGRGLWSHTDWILTQPLPAEIHDLGRSLSFWASVSSPAKWG